MQIDALQVIFLIGAVVTLGASLQVVMNRNLFHSAIWLIVALFGVAILFVLLEAGFLAAAQVVVYIGAIAILILFAVMVTRRVMQPSPEAASTEWPLALGGAALLFVLLAAPLAPFFLGIVLRVPAWLVLQPAGLSTDGSLVALGKALVEAGAAGGYALPFELASVLLVGAMIGAIAIARDRKQS